MEKKFEIIWKGSNELSSAELQKALNAFASDNDKFTVSKEWKDTSANKPEVETKEEPEDLLGMGLNFNKAQNKSNDLVGDIMGEKSKKDPLDNLKSVL